MTPALRLTRTRIAVIAVVVVLLLAATALAIRTWSPNSKTTVVGYFATANGLYVGDEVRILGVPVGTVDEIVPGPDNTEVTFSFDSRYEVPADAKAAILSPSLVSSRAIQLVPAYSGGPTLADGAEIPPDRTAVPVEWDDFRDQIQKLSQSLTPSTPDGKSSLGAFIDTTASNLRGQGTNANDALTKLSQAVATLDDSSTDIFSTIRNLQVLVSALSTSSDLMAQLNDTLAAVSGLLADDPNEVGQAMTDLDGALADVRQFVGDNRDNIGVSADRLASVTTAIEESKADVEQTLHIAPTAFQNFVNIYQPAQGALTGILAFNNFANPVQFICGAIQAAAQKGAEESAKLCAQYLGPVLKNLAMNFPPVGENVLNGAVARPDEITYSEDNLRPASAPPAAATPPATAAPPAVSIQDLLTPGGPR
jgi:phospholipid/cholesterol/gamma-HCH transport system substrate-binding protein